MADAIKRRTQSIKKQPKAMVMEALKHAGDPNVPLPYELRMAVIEPLLRAKHNHYKGAEMVKGKKSGEIKNGD